MDSRVEGLTRVQVIFTQASYNTAWMEPFNQASFFNYDTNGPVVFNQSFILPPAQLSGGNVIPTVLKINLNNGEVNTTAYNIDFKGSTTPNLQIIYSQYLGAGL